ncbi:alpha-ketoglutarate-dependent dioxygenase AlkB-like [Lolium rigidum]|uniref:alpha-ketoglutarate-dependent dioxygenase AlkB-like n=1 Tax=Lolium rigidum TaxID=89674 RepID=UPI001F5CFBA2|nr:alpha-ketoglutarate-dependent dioxygenase AlkB-like [Lolium rigidum]
MVTPVQQSRSEGLLPQTVTQVQPLKSVDSLPQMVTPVQPSVVDSLCQMVGSVQISDSLDSRSTSCASESVVGSGPGAAPFDICRGVSKCSVEVKRSLLDINREKRRAKELAKSANALQHLRPGMVLLKNFLKPDDQVKIIKQCRELGVGTGGFYQPCYKDGAKLSLRMMCLGKNWDPDSSSYVDRRPFDGAQPPKIPEDLTKVVKDAIDASHSFLEQSGGQGTSNPLKEIPPISPDICIVNFYTTAGKLGLHQDKDETKNSLVKNLPVVSFSLGDTAEFLYGDARDEAKASKVKLESGDVLIFGGQSRHIFHGVSTITPKTAPTYVTEEANLRPGRLNLTFRQY